MIFCTIAAASAALDLGIKQYVLDNVRDVFLLRKKGHTAEKTGMMLLTGGALSNLYDRIMRGKVVDYLAVKSRWKILSRLTFNLGDVCIAAGALLAALSRRK